MNKTDSSSSNQKDGWEPPSPDAIRVMKAVMADPWAPLNRLAKKIDMNRTKFTRLIKTELLSTTFIPHMLPSEEALNKLMIRFVWIKLKQGTRYKSQKALEAFAKELKIVPYVQDFYIVGGHYDFLVRLAAPNNEACERTEEAIRTLSQVFDMVEACQVRKSFRSHNHELSFLHES